MTAIERKCVRAEFKADGKPGEYVAHFARFDNVDRDGDIIRAGAFLPAFEKNPNPAVVWAHDWSTPPIGETLDASEDGTGALAKARLFIDDHPTAKQVYIGLKSGALKDHSFAYAVDEFTLREPEDGEKTTRFDGMIRELLKFDDVFEWGPTLVGANPDTDVVHAPKGMMRLALGLEAVDDEHALKAVHDLLCEMKDGRRHSAKDVEQLQSIQSIHDLALKLGAACPEEKQGPKAAKPHRLDVALLLGARPGHPLLSREES